MAPDDRDGGEDSGRYFSKVAGIALIVLSAVLLAGGSVLGSFGRIGFIQAYSQSEAAVSALEADLDRAQFAIFMWSGALLFVGVGVLLLARFPRERDRSGDEGTRPPTQRERDQSAVPTAMAAISAIDVATDGRRRAVIPDSREANAPTEDKNQASLERYLASLLQRRQLRVITETEYQTQLLQVRQLVTQRAEGAMTAREYETAARKLIG